MGGDYYDYIPFGDGRLGIVCGDVMGKGLAAALIMAMARSLLHDAIAPGKRPGDVLAEVNDGLTRDLEGQRLPYFLTLALAVYDPARPQPRRSPAAATTRCSCRAATACARCRRAAPRSACAPACEFPEDALDPRARRHRGALHRRPHRGARPRRARCSAWSGSSSSLERCQNAPVRDTLEGVWDDIAAFRGGSAPTDDATLLLVRLT